MFSLFQVQQVLECGTTNVADEEFAQKIKNNAQYMKLSGILHF